ncbi:MAG: nitroreductase [Bacteroidetes bacterium]|nr:MAG: nitroreductase [Bacteroidota bacterium]
MNEQPWQYIYAHKEDSALFNSIAESLMPGNRIWATNAPLLIVSMARKTFMDNGSHNGSAVHDTGMANYALSLQATEMGLFTHMMGGFDHSQLKQNLNLIDDLQPIVIIAVGYPGDASVLPEALKQREHAKRSRKNQTEFVFTQSQNN